MYVSVGVCVCVNWYKWGIWVGVVYMGICEWCGWVWVVWNIWVGVGYMGVGGCGVYECGWGIWVWVGVGYMGVSGV